MNKKDSLFSDVLIMNKLDSLFLDFWIVTKNDSMFSDSDFAKQRSLCLQSFELYKKTMNIKRIQEKEK